MELTETIPHRPQKRWLARVYFAIKASSISTSVSDVFSPEEQRRHFFFERMAKDLPPFIN
jgi:hypothetical protein